MNYYIKNTAEINQHNKTYVANFNPSLYECEIVYLDLFAT